jgi:hypothetical protein
LAERKHLSGELDVGPSVPSSGGRVLIFAKGELSRPTLIELAGGFLQLLYEISADQSMDVRFENSLIIERSLRRNVLERQLAV